MNPSPPTLLTYDISPTSVPVSTGTPNMAAVTVTIHASTTALCTEIVLNIPIGDAPGALFSKTPTPTSSQTGWTDANSHSSLAAQAVPSPTYHNVYLTNPDPTGAVTSSFTVTISGNVSTEQGDAEIILTERSALKSSPTAFSIKKTSLSVETALPLPLFVRSFVARDATTPTLPVSEFANGAAISLSWESNGTNFKLYRKAELEPLDLGNSTSCTIPEGITSDTTLVLVATLTSPQGDTMLYRPLTLTVSNPTLTPKQAGVGVLNNVFNHPLTVQSPDDTNPRLLGFSNAAGVDKYNFSLSGGGLNLSESNVAGGRLFIQDGGNVGIGTSTPAARLDVTGGGGTAVDLSVNGRICTGDSGGAGGVWLDKAQSQFVGQVSATTLGFWNNGAWRLTVDNSGNARLAGSDLQLLDDNHGIGYYGDSKPWGDCQPNGPVIYGWDGGALGVKEGDGRTVALRWKVSGNVGIGTNDPAQRLDVQGNAIVSGNVGIGTTAPGFPLHVVAQVSYSSSWFGYTNSDGGGHNHGDNQTFAVSIKAEGRVVSTEFDAISDARLKTIIGLSDHAADLALLRRLRITDYTMRDRVQYGDQTFKKIIAQELEEVFSQAVHQHISFLPDIYASASQVQRQGEALLITLPAGLPQAATAGQRLKLFGPAGEVQATLAKAAEAGSQQLLVTGAGSLADTPQEVFVFGLEHADVRTVDYEAVAMLNVSATQDLARQVEELHQQNAALYEQLQIQRAECSQTRAALEQLQAQVASLLSAPVAAISTQAFAPSAS